MKKLKKNTLVINGILILIAIILPLCYASNRYMMDIFINLCIYVILGASLNLMLGYTGQISMGQAAFFGIGAYTATLLRMKLDVPFLFAMIGAILLCFLVGVVFGIPSTRMNTIFLSIATAGLNSIVVLILRNWRKLTKGASGISGIPQLLVFGEKITKIQYYFLALACTLVVLLLCYRIVYSRTGRAFMAIKGTLIAASSMGIDVVRYKLLVFALGAAFSAVAGSLYAFNIRFISPDAFSSTMSIKILCMSVLGGMGNLYGAVLGSVIIGVLPELLRDYASLQLTLYGLFIVLVLRFMPGGIMALVNRVIFLVKHKVAQKKLNTPKEGG